MPIYDLQCENCGHVFERLMKLSEESPVCEKCNGTTIRLIGTPVFSGSGAGWCGSKAQRKHKGIKPKE